MSEFWVSKNKFYCTYCKIYIADDKPSRQHHDSGMRHKGNLERYIRDIYKKGAQKEKHKLEEERELKAINAAAAAAMGLAPEPSTSSKPITSKKPAPGPAPKSSNPFANYSSAESLGYLDPEAVQAAKEKEERQTEGRAGEWSYVTSSTRTSAEVEPTEEEVKEQERQERWAQTDPDRKKMTFSYLKEKTLPNLDDDEEAAYDRIKIKVRAPKPTLHDSGVAEDPLAKARAQAEKLAPPNAKPASSAASTKMKFKAIVPREQEEEEAETEADKQARNQAAWELIAPGGEWAEEEKKPDVASSSMFKKKRKAGSSTPAGDGVPISSSSKRRVLE